MDCPSGAYGFAVYRYFGFELSDLLLFVKFVAKCIFVSSFVFLG